MVKIKEIFKINNKTKFACGITECGDLFIGYANQPLSLEYFKYSEAMKKHVLEQWKIYKNFYS